MRKVLPLCKGDSLWSLLTRLKPVSPLPTLLFPHGGGGARARHQPCPPCRCLCLTQTSLPPGPCRAQLDAVLARQAQLQQLWEQHIVSKGGSAAPAVPAANGAAASSAAGKTNQQAATVVAA